ncbi:hypothetical protein ACEWY4_016236 [Coilia grayii]|uniref:DNA repair protein complementing XP-G cells n=1 Tax=Coilia grayii TaxID=363190 RepID=A0ABD1JN70_9TELE
MGVHGLWKLLESTGKPINPETLEGKILAVDISIWLNQALKGVRDRDGNTMQNAHLLTLFHRLCKLLFFRIRPVFVFDGDAPLLKKQTLAIRRQRKEEKTQESKETKKKLLRTLLKRHAIKAAVGDTSQEAVPSLSTARREEADDMYVLPALPVPEERENSFDDDEEALEWETHNNWQDMYEDPSAVDINSEQFSQLPPEIKHEILKDMKEFSKRRRTMYQKPPEKAGDFSQYQLAGLLQRNRLNQRLEGVQQEMSQQSSAGLNLPEEMQQNMETRRLVSEDSSHYILIKGPKNKSLKAPEGPSFSSQGTKHVKPKGKPEALWQPIPETSFEEDHTASSSKPPSQPDRGPVSDLHRPPSPRTLQAIQAAMDSSSEEDDDKDTRGVPGGSWGGDMSPRTLAAVQNAMLEEQTGFSLPSEGKEGSRQLPQMDSSLSRELQHLGTETIFGQNNLHTPNKIIIPHRDTVIISSSEEELDAGADDSPDPEHISNRNMNLNVEHLPTKVCTQKQDGIASPKTLGTVQRGVSRALEDQESSTGEEEMMDDGDFNTSKAALQGDEESIKRVRSTDVPAVNMKEKTVTSSDSKSCELQTSTTSLSLETVSSLSESHEGISTIQTSPKENPGNLRGFEGNDQGIKSEEEEEEERHSQKGDRSESDESSAEENFIEVSEGEEEWEEPPPSELLLKKEAALSVMKPPEDTRSPKEEEEAVKQEMIKELDSKDLESSRSTSQSTEDTDEKGRSPPPPANDWDNIDLAELKELESSLQEEQHALRGQQQQQERVAATVTGQMCQESQELLRLFGIPFLVAPMEAEAQCAALDRADLTHGTITDDSDIWLFGGRHVYKNFFSQNKYVEYFQFVDLQNQLGLDRYKMINLAYLLGSDYTEGIPGVGYVTGMEILNEFPGPATEPLTQFSKWWEEAQKNKKLVANPNDTKVKRKLRGLKLQPGFPNPSVAQAYLQPAVDQSEASFSWGRPHLELIKEFCQNRFGWTYRKTDETLQPVLRQLNSQQTQLRIDSFFRLEQQERQKIQSQRLRRAVTCMKRKGRGEAEDEEGGDDNDDDGNKTPRKGTKKGKTVRSEADEEPVSSSFVGGSAGGFLGSEEKGVDLGPIEEPVVKSRASVKITPPPSQENKVKPLKPKEKPCPREAVLDSSSSDSEDDENGRTGAMVTAQSVFSSKPQRKGRRGGRGRGKRGL